MTAPLSIHVTFENACAALLVQAQSGGLIARLDAIMGIEALARDAKAMLLEERGADIVAYFKEALEDFKEMDDD